jgi:ketosteroid isomerase-like protein
MEIKEKTMPNQPTASQILELEECLRQAMLASDVKRLDALIAPEIIITNHLGELHTKEADLEAHRSGLIKIHQLTPSEQQIQLRPALAIVTVRMQIVGDYDGMPASGDFRFTRVWAPAIHGSWQIVAAHIGQVMS